MKNLLEKYPIFCIFYTFGLFFYCLPENLFNDILRNSNILVISCLISPEF